jgi:hypothetical protein
LAQWRWQKSVHPTLNATRKSGLQEYSLHGGDKIGNNGQLGATSKPVTPGTVNRELSTLSHLLTKAVEWKWLDSKPAQVKLLKVENGV